jgi:integrase
VGVWEEETDTPSESHQGRNFSTSGHNTPLWSFNRSLETSSLGLTGKNRPTILSGRRTGVKKCEQPGLTPPTEEEATNHLNRMFAGWRWTVVPGWHALRHGFASICASKEIDQRLIDVWMGHQTLGQQRYQHLFPQQRDAIRSAFG